MDAPNPCNYTVLLTDINKELYLSDISDLVGIDYLLAANAKTMEISVKFGDCNVPWPQLREQYTHLWCWPCKKVSGFSLCWTPVTVGMLVPLSGYASP